MYCSHPESLAFLHDMQVAQDTSSEGVHVPSYDAWDGLSLTYDLRWPLHILLTPEVDHIGTWHGSTEIDRMLLCPD